MSSTVDGLVSGLNTTSLISQLMTAEAAPQQKLKNKVTSTQTAQKAYQGINTLMSALKTATEGLTLPTGWQTMKANASDPSITVSATSAAVAGQVSFDVTQLSRAQVTTAKMPDSGDVVGGGGFNLTIGVGDKAVTTNIPITDLKANTAQGLADAINAKGLSVRAAVVATDSGTMLQLSSTKAGEANAFTADGLTGDVAKVAVTARNAKLSIGDQDAGGYTVSSESNTFTNVLPGLTVTANAVTTKSATVTVGGDNEALAGKMAAIVEAANQALAGIGAQSGYDASTKTGGPLLADSATRFMSLNILSAVSGGKTGFGSFSKLGVATDQTGKLTFDKEKFLSALQADPAKVQDAVLNGVAKSLNDLAKKATNAVDGTLTVAIQGGDSKIKDLNNRIADWDVRLQTRKSALQRQFSSLEVSLGKLKDQSQWLSAQLGSLPTGKS
jgi:flagellar hook-associated protein 2